jgi:hypothetical protein
MIASHSFGVDARHALFGLVAQLQGCLGWGHQGSLKFLNKTRPTIDQVSIQN